MVHGHLEIRDCRTDRAYSCVHGFFQATEDRHCWICTTCMRLAAVLCPQSAFAICHGEQDEAFSDEAFVLHAAQLPRCGAFADITILKLTSRFCSRMPTQKPSKGECREGIVSDRFRVPTRHASYLSDGSRT